MQVFSSSIIQSHQRKKNEKQKNTCLTAQKMKFSIKDFFIKYDRIRSQCFACIELMIYLHAL